MQPIKGSQCINIESKQFIKTRGQLITGKTSNVKGLENKSRPSCRNEAGIEKK